MVSAVLVSFSPSPPLPPTREPEIQDKLTHTPNNKTHRPRTDKITLSLLARAKAAGFTALVVTLDTKLLGWRPHDIQTQYLPFLHGVGIQVGTSDPVFCKRYGLPAYPHNQGPAGEGGEDGHPTWPYNPRREDARYLQGDEGVRKRSELGRAWLGECNSGAFRTWEDVKFLREHWEGPIVLKGVQSIAVSPFSGCGLVGCY